MKEFKIERYDDSLSQVWDDFVGTSKNGTFMLTRKFISYHHDRFEDSSLLVYKKTKLIAVFPANSKENTIYSHQGLSYGGLILPKQIKLKDVL
ncbi:MAG: GNAT family N-acetyltransferase, partial [Flavobacteriaceae bacterium]